MASGDGMGNADMRGWMKVERWQLKQRQVLPLEAKIVLSRQRIKQWHEYWDGEVYVSFSGGKDSTVLLHLVRSVYPGCPAVFFNTGLEFPEIVQFARRAADITFVQPPMSFSDVIERYGYPVVSKETSQKIYEVRTTKSDKLRHKRLHGANNKYKSGKIPECWKFLIDAPFAISHKCCDVLKKRPAHKYEKETDRHRILGTMAEDSHFRRQSYMRYGCNAFDLKAPRSMPMSFWTTEDVWDYIGREGLEYSPIYDMGYKMTGCAACAFGVHREGEPNKFQMLHRTHPKLWSYCMDKLGLREVLDYIGIPYEL